MGDDGQLVVRYHREQVGGIVVVAYSRRATILVRETGPSGDCRQRTGLVVKNGRTRELVPMLPEVSPEIQR